jgi:hypothetical protein
MDWIAIALSLKLAALVAGILLLLALPIAYWLTFSTWRGKFAVEAVVALPLVLPPTVLGFYVLLAIGSRSPIGRLWTSWTDTVSRSRRPRARIHSQPAVRRAAHQRRFAQLDARCSTRRRRSAPVRGGPSRASSSPSPSKASSPELC